MNHLRTVVLALIIISVTYSCKKDSTPVECIPDPREAAAGTYNMEDSVFFQGDLAQNLAIYDLKVSLDTLTGDTILLENMFNFSIDLKAVYDASTGNFTIPSQMDDDAFVSGAGTISGNTISYNASYNDGGYSFKGYGVRN